MSSPGVRWAGQAGVTYLQGVPSVIQTVDAEAVLQRGAAEWPEDGQLQALCGCFGGGLPNQGVGAKVLGEEVAGLCVQLNVAGGGEVFLSDHHHILWDEKEGAATEPPGCRDGGQQGCTEQDDFSRVLILPFPALFFFLCLYYTSINISILNHSLPYVPCLYADNMLYLEDLDLVSFDLLRIYIPGIYVKFQKKCISYPFNFSIFELIICF